MDFQTLLKDNSIEEINAIKGNLKLEIDKRTLLLKSNVQERYLDIVETSDSIVAIKDQLETIKQSKMDFYCNIDEFYSKIKNTKDLNKGVGSEQAAKSSKNIFDKESKIVDVLRCLEEIWTSLDNDNISNAVYYMEKGEKLVTNLTFNDSSDKSCQSSLERLKLSLKRSKNMIENKVNLKLQQEKPDAMGTCSENDDSCL